MAKKSYDVTDIFGAMAEERKGMKKEASTEAKVEVVAEPEIKEPAVTVKEEPKVKPQKEKKEQGNKETRKQGNKETSLQGNSEPKNYYYGKKRTHAYPDDLWEKFEIILKIKGEKQNAKMIELVTAYVEENEEIIEMWNKLQGAKK